MSSPSQIDLDVYVSNNYHKLSAKYGSDAVNDLYVHFRRVLASPNLEQPRDLAACFGTAAYFNFAKSKKTNEVKLKTEPATYQNEYLPDYDKVVKCFNCLAPQEWQCFKRHIFYDLSCPEIADELGLSRITVKTYIRTAVTRIRKMLGEQNEQQIRTRF